MAGAFGAPAMLHAQSATSVRPIVAPPPVPGANPLAPAAPAFGAPIGSAFGAPSASAFGAAPVIAPTSAAPALPAAGSAFGAPAVTAFRAPAMPAFGAAPLRAGAFPAPAFGAPNAFGAAATTLEAKISSNPYGNAEFFAAVSAPTTSVAAPVVQPPVKPLMSSSSTISSGPNAIKYAAFQPVNHRPTNYHSLFDSTAMLPRLAEQQPRSSVKKLVISPSSLSVATPPHTPGPVLGMSTPTTSVISDVHKSFSIPPAMMDITVPTPVSLQRDDEDISSPSDRMQEDELADSEQSDERSVCERIRPQVEVAIASEDDDYIKSRFAFARNPSLPKLTRKGYYTNPSITLLSSFSDEQLAAVSNFEVGRHHFGVVQWPGTTDVRSLDLDAIVEFNPREIVVYPNENAKPAVGEELNKPAIVCLENCHRVDRKTGSPRIDSMSAQRQLARIKKATERAGATFLDYDGSTGSWTFQVPHFSRYGLEDDSDEDDEDGDEEMTEPGTVTDRAQSARAVAAGTGPVVNRPVAAGATAVKPPLTSPAKRFALSVDSDSDEAETSARRASFVDDDIPPTMNSVDTDVSLGLYSSVSLPERLNLDTERLHAMNQSLFRDEEQLVTDQLWSEQLNYSIVSSNSVPPVATATTPAGKSSSLNSIRTPFGARSAASAVLPTGSILRSAVRPHLGLSTAEPVAPAPVARAHTVEAVRHSTAVPYVPLDASVTHLRHGQSRDSRLFLGRSFRASWSADGSLLRPFVTRRRVAVRANLNLLDGRQLNSSGGKFVIARSRLEVQQQSDVHVEALQELLGATVAADRTPLLTLKRDNVMNAVRRLANLAPAWNAVWKLVEALWGSIHEDDAGVMDSYAESVTRKLRLSAWLESTVAAAVDKQARASSDLDIVFHLLTGRQIANAVSHCVKLRNVRLATLMAQQGGISGVQQDVQDQIDFWYKSGHLDFMPVSLVRVYRLLSGDVNAVASGLDWKRCLALQLWYGTHAATSVLDVLQQYDLAVESGFAAAPLPEYLALAGVSNEATAQRDIIYHLLHLYRDKLHPLEAALAAGTMNQHPLDYGISWMLHRVLVCLGYAPLAPQREHELTMNFVTQLEIAGNWRWALFVVLATPELASHPLAIATARELLNRHIGLDDVHCSAAEMSERDDFLLNHLRIPAVWLSEAKALAAHARGDVEAEVYHSIAAELLDRAHDAIVRHVAADYIVSQRLTELRELLTPLATNQHLIRTWHEQGGVFWNYLDVVKRLPAHLHDVGTGVAGAMQSVLDLEATMISLCQSLSVWKPASALQRVCVAEMSATIAGLMAQITQLTAPLNPHASHLAVLLPDLQMPEDYRFSQVQQLCSEFVTWRENPVMMSDA
eukprot:TRINITY_DN533_c0_g1_i1.p1 TRINITY_DN533_c0_g1~~TRINITY_DN533_c0_g1_i1.p1  ORF type:complete len:1374 (-),score=288.84 TRINITY_DN533_c0_g1_i1:906-4985(-)